MDKMNLLLIATTFSTGIMAGLFFAWVVSVMNGQAKLPDREFLLSVQSMNREIQNPVFFLFFFGTAILLPVCAFISYGGYSPGSFSLIMVATALYLLGVIGITIAGNIPLNNWLDSFVVEAAKMEDMADLRKRFEGPWNKWNLARAICNAVAFLLLLVSMIKK